MTKVQKTSWSHKKRLVIGLTVLLGLLFSFFIVSYFLARPNYRDLNNAYNKLPLPGDWMVTQEYSEKGNWGLFCFTTGIDISCPYLQKTLSTKNAYNPVSVGKSVQSAMGSAGWNPKQECSIVEKNTCYNLFTGYKSGIKLTIGFGKNNKGGTDFGVTLAPYKK